MNFFQAKMTLLTLLAMPFLGNSQQAKKNPGGYYQLTVYHFTTPEQQTIIDQYLREAYLPALHRANIPAVGVFKALANDTATDKRIYVLLPVKSLQQVTDITGLLAADKTYQAAGKNYLDAAYTSPPYTRMENILLRAFAQAPNLILPKLNGPRSERIYELRSYESQTEKIHVNKVHMFNEGGEVALFKQLNFNAIFYGSVIAGSKMPNLMYITSFENKADRDAHWKNFGAAPEWKKLAALPQYQNNVSKNEQTFLFPTDYSDY